MNQGRTHVALLLVGILVTPQLGQCQETKPETPPASAADVEYRKLCEERDKAIQEFLRPYSEATSQEKREKVRLDFSKHPQYTYVPKFLVLAEKHPKTPAAIESLIYVVQNARPAGGILGLLGGGDPTVKKATDQLLRDHLGDKQLQTVLPNLIYAQGFDRAAFLKTVVEKSPHREVKGVATYCIAQSLRQGGLFGQFDEKRVVELLERVEKDFFDVPLYPQAAGDLRWQLGNLAKSELFELRFLVIGKVAPEIASEDIDGVKFKLSDYRGKVVVIDFWGDW